MGGRDIRGLDLGLLGVSPVIIRDRGKCAWTMELEHWIRERVGNTEAGQRRSNGPNDHAFWNASGNDETADANAVTGQNVDPT